MPVDKRRTPAMADDRSDIRPGEVKTALPQCFDASLYFIGRIRTPCTFIASDREA